jgi:hypothetical protein
VGVHTNHTLMFDRHRKRKLWTQKCLKSSWLWSYCLPL